ncbi:porin [Salipiger marinus]|uniref:porin n=1 Tax=Salipiger marinus TaxID=555512 RepID=UPI001E4063FD|nr:porin [Salipiger manganoxidans]MCD1617066.1 porin [Salipiger manganoxidans]MEB3417114.1 porin [Salipiger manganoxidans]
MKKILFATTALVATAGFAAAEVAITGEAEMGIYNPNTEAQETQFFTDLDVRFTMTGEADNGLTFGATIDLDEAADRSNPGKFESPNTQGGENMFVAFGGARLTMGDTDGAVDFAVPEMGLAGGSLNDDETAHAGFNDADGFLDGTIFGVADDSGLAFDGAGDGQVARFDYSYDAFTFSVSAEQLANGDDVEVTVGTETFDLGSTVWGVGVSYSGDLSGVALTAGLGYQTIEDIGDITSVGVTGELTNGLSLGATYTQFASDIDGFDDIEHVGVGVGYSMDAVAVGVNWGQFDQDGDTIEGWGLAGTYDLGGGLSARLGYGKNDFSDVGGDDYNTWSLGLRMNF